MKKWLSFAWVTAVVLVFSAMAAAGTTVTGPTGLLTIPTADVLLQGELSFGYHLRNGEGIGNISYGLLPGAEIGLLTAGPGHSDFGVHGKVVLSREGSSLPGVAVGLCDDSFYMVASKRLAGVGVRGHVGVGTGHYDGLFLGVSKMLNSVVVDSGPKGFAAPAALLAVEYVKGSFNLGVDVLLSPAVRIKAAVEDFDDLTLGVNFKIAI
ncbi:MAG TPA: YjbH domain-containing protein [Firmicutes bacterium]|nr:YjbH domain-containing protein [Bacillota bacterium]